MPPRYHTLGVGEGLSGFGGVTAFPSRTCIVPPAMVQSQFKLNRKFPFPAVHHSWTAIAAYSLQSATSFFTASWLAVAFSNMPKFQL